jgi:small conductance mechanosensitive channel
MEDINIQLGLLWEKLEAWGNQIVLLVPNIFLAAVFLFLTFKGASLFRGWFSRFISRFSESKALNNLVLTLLYVGMLLVGFFIVLNLLNLDRLVVSMLAGVGILGLALGFAFQDIAANFVAGVIIALRKPFRVGDLIETNDYRGIIERITLRTIDIRQLTGEEVHIPNKTVFENPVTNYSVHGTRRVDLEVGVSYAEDLEQVQQVITDAVEGAKNRVADSDIDVLFDAFDDSSINFKVRFWITFNKEIDYLQAKSDAGIRIKKALDAADILIPFPIRTLDFGIKGGERLDEQLCSVSALLQKDNPAGGNGKPGKH